jgi:N-formylglutamate deformylase
MSQTVPLFISIPHSGEKIPDQTPWLNQLPETLLMSDVDRYVDRLYMPTLTELKIPFQTTEWHRYAVDLNRIPEDVSQSSVKGAAKEKGAHLDGYHWVMTKGEELIMAEPMSVETHRELTQLIYEPFHLGVRNVFHIDAHSMPSFGTRMHRDPGEKRADVVVSDCLGKSCDKKFRDLVIAAYATSGFKVGYNWPYMGGRVTEQYGQPNNGQHAIQVEISRSLYMNEVDKQILDSHSQIIEKIKQAVSYLKSELPKLNI